MEKYEKVITMMAKEIKNLQEGKEPEITNFKNKAIGEAEKELRKKDDENKELVKKLEVAVKIKRKLPRL